MDGSVDALVPRGAPSSNPHNEGILSHLPQKYQFNLGGTSERTSSRGLHLDLHPGPDLGVLVVVNRRSLKSDARKTTRKVAEGLDVDRSTVVRHLHRGGNQKSSTNHELEQLLNPVGTVTLETYCQDIGKMHQKTVTFMASIGLSKTTHSSA
ncbi:hypothetical protein CEXT_294981 [Caerostris extrusa]|uniref:Transposase n=1 Tax=Caerostris extrusa TaxID=172846 RepID=A0AAV4RUT8_CAEEX|nr:hypothetical protein CEXT_294981 [Caerostris extrusa]